MTKQLDQLKLSPLYIRLPEPNFGSRFIAIDDMRRLLSDGRFISGPIEYIVRKSLHLDCSNEVNFDASHEGVLYEIRGVSQGNTSCSLLPSKQKGFGRQRNSEEFVSKLNRMEGYIVASTFMAYEHCFIFWVPSSHIISYGVEKLPASISLNKIAKIYDINDFKKIMRIVISKDPEKDCLYSIQGTDIILMEN